MSVLEELRKYRDEPGQLAGAMDGWIMYHRTQARIYAAVLVSSSLMLAVLFPAYASTGFPVLVFLALLFLAFAYINRASERRLSRAVGLLGKNLDPEPLLLEARSQLSLVRKGQTGKKQALLDYLAIAQVNSGMHQEAVATFEQLQKGNDAQLKAYSRFMGVSSKVFLCLKEGNAAGAEAEIEKAEALLADSTLPEAFRTARTEGLRLMKIRAKILRRQLEGIEKALTDFHRKFEKDSAKQLEIRFCMGLYWQAAEDHARARDEFDFVLRNGGKLYLSDEARTKLNAMALEGAMPAAGAGDSA